MDDKAHNPARVSSAHEIIESALLKRLARSPKRPLILGLCGAQGSGKSTLAAQLAASLPKHGVHCAVLSLDDLYLSSAARARLARKMHPLLRTRGVPGTHDVNLGIAIIETLRRGEATPLPRFDKARDEPCSEGDWPMIERRLDVLVFEGWCVGAAAQSDDALTVPINALERDQDPDGRWRRSVNTMLSEAYQKLFGLLDVLMLLAAPGFDIVATWRTQQEQTLRQRLIDEGVSTPRVMTETDVEQFVQHYERLTRHILEEMPARADVVVCLDVGRSVTGFIDRLIA